MRVINIEENIGKTVGRKGVPDPLALDPDEKQDCIAMRKSGMGPYLPRKGVYKFKTHEEADQWMMNQLTRKRVS